MANRDFLKEVIQEFKQQGIRTSIFLDSDAAQVEAAVKTGTDRIELSTPKPMPKNIQKTQQKP